MIEMGRRAFSEADQRAFAALSGDANPLHVDAAVARRTVFGHCVVHGVHQVLWALEAWLAARGESSARAVREAKFLRGLGIGVPAVCRAERQDGAEFALELSAGSAVAELAGGALTVFYPSTIFLDQPAAGLAEYAAAKAAGEALGRQFAGRFPQMKFHAPRLPRLSTDLTAGLLPRAAQEPLAVLLPALRALGPA